MNLENLVRDELEGWAHEVPVPLVDPQSIARRVQSRRRRHRRRMGIGVVGLAGVATLLAITVATPDDSEVTTIPATDAPTTIGTAPGTTAAGPAPTGTTELSSPLAFPSDVVPSVVSDNPKAEIGHTYGSSGAEVTAAVYPAFLSGSGGLFGDDRLLVSIGTVGSDGAETGTLPDGRPFVRQPGIDELEQVYGWTFSDGSSASMLTRGITDEVALQVATSAYIDDGAIRVDVPAGMQQSIFLPPPDGQVTRIEIQITLGSHDIRLAADNAAAIAFSFWRATHPNLLVHGQPAAYNEDIRTLVWFEGSWNWALRADLPLDELVEFANTLRAPDVDKRSAPTTTLPMGDPSQSAVTRNVFYDTENGLFVTDEFVLSGNTRAIVTSRDLWWIHGGSTGKSERVTMGRFDVHRLDPDQPVPGELVGGDEPGHRYLDVPDCPGGVSLAPGDVSDPSSVPFTCDPTGATGVLDLFRSSYTLRP